MDDPKVLVGRGRARLHPRGRGSRGAAGLVRTFSSARFALAADGRALWVPAPAHVADDLAPVPGTWAPEGAAARVAYHRAAGPTRRVSVQGLVTGAGFAGSHEMVDGDDVHTHDVEVALDGSPAALAAAGARRIDQVTVPVRAHGTLTGTCDGAPVDGASLQISIIDPVDGADQPLELHLASTSPLDVGALLWMSGAPGLSAEDTGRYAVRVAGEEILASCDAVTDTALGITFDVPARPPSGLSAAGLAELPAIVLPVPARRARLRLRCTADRGAAAVAGSVELDGRLQDRDVALRGELRAAGPLPVPQDLEAAGFERLWARAIG